MRTPAAQKEQCRHFVPRRLPLSDDPHPIPIAASSVVASLGTFTTPK